MQRTERFLGGVLMASVSLLLGGCTSNTADEMKNEKTEKWHASVLEMIALDEIPGASGLVRYQSDWLVTGDNSPYVFRLNDVLNVQERIRIYEHIEEVIPKSEKPDFESMEVYADHELLILGSGSKSPQRDVFVTVDLRSGEKSVYNVSSLFASLRQLDAMQNGELNLEAMAIVGEQIWLFNRRPNLIFVFPLDAFLKSCRGEKGVPQPEVLELDLPQINGVSAGFSGACYDPQNNKVIVTASVEDTDNAYDDGRVLGSFIGVLDVDAPNCSGKCFTRLKKDGHSVEWKVESVWISGYGNQRIELFMVTDSDGQGSGLVKCRLERG